MEYCIENRFIKAIIKSKGAELIKLIDKDQVNRLHTPSVESWNKVSPVLFPQISHIRGGKYYVNGKEYEMPKHGFFKEFEYSPIKTSKTSLTFKLEDSEETLKMYPYHFAFYVTYSLCFNKLKVTYKVKNKGESNMYYMVGGHPALKAPLFNSESYEDYYIKFPKKETSRAMQIVDGHLANEFKLYLSNEDRIDLKHSLYDPDAIVLMDLKSKYVDLKNSRNKKAIRFYFKDYPILAFWSLLNNDKANYVCFEPWAGIQKDFVTEQTKMGINMLLPNKTDKYSYTIKVIN